MNRQFQTIKQAGRITGFAGLLSLSLLAPSAAWADVTACLTAPDGEPLVGLRVTYDPLWWEHYEFESGADGCFDVPTTNPRPTVTVHAATRVVQMVQNGIPVAADITVRDNQRVALSPDYVTASVIREFYEEGWRGFGPFTSASPVGGTLAQGPYITADLDSSMVVDLSYVEPAPLGFQLPRIHLEAGIDGDHWTVAHELAHALHFSQLPLVERLELEAYYIGWLAGPDHFHSFSEPSTDVIAYVEAFGAVGETFRSAAQGTNNAIELENAFIAQALDETEHLRSTGDDTIEGVVFGIMFGELAEAVGLDYVIDTYIDCGSHTFQEYVDCIAEREGEKSMVFSTLRIAANEFDIQLIPLGDGNFCTSDYRCTHGEGDCDNDNECVLGTYCVDNVGSEHGMASWVDVCLVPTPNPGDIFCRIPEMCSL